ncbi:MAG TPA: FtsX-like permease family protein [Candidatus Ozemobacteraceae bacterium]|nr:FtsX-like permease family protein [Candidatus Ozemobacteraceae bacterium]
MKPYDPFTVAVREQLRRPGRAFTVMLGFLLAVAAFVGFSLLFQADRMAEDELLKRVGGYFAAFSPLPPVGAATPPAMLPRMVNPDEGFVANTVLTCLLPRALTTTLRAAAGVADAVPVLMFRMKNRVDGHLFTLGGMDMSRPLAVERTCCAPSDMKKGVFLGMATGTEGPGAMLDEGYASVRYCRVGDRIRIGGMDFPVTGIINTGVRPVHADVYLTWSDAEKAMAPSLAEPLGDRANIFLIEVRSASEQDAAIAAVKAETGGVITSYNCYRPASKVVGLNEKTAGILAWVLYLAAVLFSLKTQLAALVERRREFGVLRSIGWPDRVIGAQLIWESLIPSTAGAFLGAALGTALALFAGGIVLDDSAATGMLAMDFRLITRGVLIALAGSAFSGLIAAFFFRRSSPAEMLRSI